MDSKRISLIIVFTALAAFLNMSPIKIPAPYAPFLIYQVWEIPIVAASLLFGLTVGIATTFINTLILFVVFPGVLPTGPVYNMVAVLAMLVGVWVGRDVIKMLHKGIEGIASVALATTLGAVVRVLVMTVVNWGCLPLPPPVGFSYPVEVVIPLLPVIGFFNASIVLYTVPMAYVLMKSIKSRVAGVSSTGQEIYGREKGRMVNGK